MFIKHILDEKLTIFPEFKEQPASSTDLSTLGASIPDFLYKLKNGGYSKEAKFNKIKERFSETFPGLELFLEEQKIVLVNKTTRSEIPREAIGTGIIEAINIISHLISSDGKIFLIDESDLHLDPRAKRVMFNIIRESSEKNQVICITDHSSLIHLNQIPYVTLARDAEGKSKLSDIQCLN